MKRCSVAGHSLGRVRDERSVGCWSGSLAVHAAEDDKSLSSHNGLLLAE